MTLNSALYTGVIRHRRHAPRKHHFCYRISLLWLDLSEQQRVFSLSSLWSGRWWSPMRFSERDYLKDQRTEGETLSDTARRLVKEQLGKQLDGPVRVLTQVRSFGMLFNPVSFFIVMIRKANFRRLLPKFPIRRGASVSAMSWPPIRHSRCSTSSSIRRSMYHRFCRRN